AIPAGVHQTGSFKQIEVLRDRLSRGGDLVPHDQPIADLEERLAIAISQLVEDLASGGIGQGFEHIAHVTMIGKYFLAYQPLSGRTGRAAAGEAQPLVVVWC